MGGEWKEVKLSDLGEVSRGKSKHRPRYAEHLYGGPYPFIQTGDIRLSGGRITSHSQTYSDAGLAQSRIWPAGTLCITIAANIAETALLTYPACFPDSVIGFIADTSKCDVNFIEYTFRFLKRRIQLEAIGSVQDNINLATFERLRFPLPPLPEQRAIAHILGTLDDKIELNRKMNATLEEMARALFKSWFVDFDPVRAKAEGRATGLPKAIADLFPSSFVDSELGEIPKGWRVGKLGDVAEISSGKRPVNRSNEQTREFPIPMYGGGGILAYTSEALTDNKTLVTGRVGTLGQIFRVTIPFWPSDNTLLISAKDSVWFEYLFHVLCGFDLQSLNRGSTQPLLTQTDLSKQLVIQPHEAVVREFHKLTNSNCECVDSSERQSRTLASLRDTLLPKLISGELRVKDAEKIVGDAV